MKFILLITLLLTNACSFSQKKEQPLNQDLKITSLNEQSFVIQDTSFYESNILVSKMPDETVIIASSPIDTKKTKELLQWIKQNLNPKKIIAINTHFHFDGTGGNEAYVDAGVQVWSSHMTKKLYEKRASSMRSSLAKSLTDKNQQQNLLNTKNKSANHFFSENKGLKFNYKDQEVIVFYPGPAHSPDNLVVYLPQQKILFGGCMVRALNYDLGNTKDADLKRYYESAKSLKNFDAKVVIPGHGKIGSTDLVDHTIDLAKKAKEK